MDSNTTILKSAGKFLSGTLISRFTGLLRDITMAWAFGTSAPLAAFFIAFRLTQVPRRILGEGGMQTAFIPQYEKLKTEDPKRASTFFKDLHAWFVLVLGGAILGIMALLYAITYFISFSDGNREILHMTLFMFPSLYFICLYALNASLLQSEGSYFTSGIAPVAFNIVWIVAAFVLSPLTAEQAMPPLAFAIVLGSLAQWLMTVPETKRLLPFSLFRGFHLASADLRILLKPLFLANLGVVATQINSALDPLFARWAHPEGPAWLWYAIRMEQLPLALFGIALSGALLPPLSRAAKEGRFDQFKAFLITALKRSSALMIPITGLIFLLGGFSVRLLFGRGDFGESSIYGTTLCLFGYAIGLVPQTWVLLLAPAFYALGDYKTPAKGALISVLINGILNALFVFGFKWGPESVAIATSLSTLFNCVYLSVRALNTLPKLKAPALDM